MRGGWGGELVCVGGVVEGVCRRCGGGEGRVEWVERVCVVWGVWRTAQEMVGEVRAGRGGWGGGWWLGCRGSVPLGSSPATVSPPILTPPPLTPHPDTPAHPPPPS